jgi:signal peptidase I
MKERLELKHFLKEILITLGAALVIYLVITVFIQNSEVYDISMQPTLVEGQRLIVLKQFYTPQRGDIVIVHPPTEPDKEYVKRLIGLPGDTVEVKNGTVYVNNVSLDEPYLNEKPKYTFPPYVVPEDNYFVMGDNRNHSNDSHYNWTVTGSEIVGRAWLRYWPFSEWGNAGAYPLNDQVASGQTAGATSEN